MPINRTLRPQPPATPETWCYVLILFSSTAISLTHICQNVSYGSGNFSGKQFIDRVALSQNLTIESQSIGAASHSTGFESGIDGILGIGPVALTKGTVNDDEIPTVAGNLFSQGTIANDTVGISFSPWTQDTPNAGEGFLAFGGTDPSRYIGEIAYTPITQTSPASNYVGIDASFSYGNEPVLDLNAGIVDSGTTLLLLSTDALKKYLSSTGAEVDKITGLPSVTGDQYSKMENLFVSVGEATYELVPDAQRWPGGLNTDIGGNSSSIYLAVGDIGSQSRQGLDFILGMAFL